MPPYACRCSFETSDHDEFVDHVLEAFNGSDDIGTDGRAHAELAGEMRTCACGYVALSPLDLDRHLLGMFAPPSGIGTDGIQHTTSLPGSP
jgi:hypothetical protein